MFKDPTEFRQRFAAYKNGKKPYDAGRPVQEDGHDWSYGGWKQKISKYLGIDIDHDNGYDYEGYFNKYPKEAWAMLKGDPRAHFTDEFKTVYHPTFSQKSKNNDGSVYSGVVHPKYNPQGLVGGIWSPDYKTFTMSSDGYRGPVNMDDRRWYLENNEDNGVILREANGNLPVYDGIIWGGVLPNVTVTGHKLPKYGGGKWASGLFPINIPAAIKGFYNSVKERAYRTITPQDYNIPKAAKEFVSGKNRNKQDISPARNEEWARYLGVPYEGESNFEPSPYRPQKGKTYDTVLRFKDESDILSDQVLNQMLEYQKKTGKNSQLIKGDGGGLGSYTISLGEDEKGPYISYYDDWDINPFKGISAKLNIPVLSNIEDIVPGSNPYTVYGRRYYQKR